MTQKLPLVLPSTLRANENQALPRYYGAGVAGDWVGGSVGNDVNAATAAVAVVHSASAATTADYGPRTQTARGAGMTPNLTVLADLGKDYGTYGGMEGRDGTIQPRQPYPMQAGHQ